MITGVYVYAVEQWPLYIQINLLDIWTPYPANLPIHMPQWQFRNHDYSSHSEDLRLLNSSLYLNFVSSRERLWCHWTRQRIHAARRILYASIPVFLFERVRNHTSCARNDNRIPCWRHGHSWGETKYTWIRFKNAPTFAIINQNTYQIFFDEMLEFEHDLLPG